ncbi:NADPH-dependent FMN reductase, partial [Morganella morganii]|uniref:NADPH-dependent FMN reductase n=1 Tax=Morganella morganii TaxID=582 RepID=UPI0015F3FD6A
VAVFVGSLREQSYNRQLAHALFSLFPAHIQCEFVIIGSLPLYNQFCDAQPPAELLAFKQQISQPAGVIFVPPEITLSFPVGLKNPPDTGYRP